MANPLGMAAQLGGNALRFGWYFGVNRMVDRVARRENARGTYTPERPVPSQREILADLAQLFVADAQAVRDGLYPPTTVEAVDLPRDIGRVRRMLADLPSALSRRVSRDATTVAAAGQTADLPDYYLQDFHFQTGGYLTEESAELYDVQVDTLFYGAANAMRRAALRPIATYMAGRDQRRMSLLDVACGTGRLLRDIRLAWPAITLTGLDLSRAYLDEAARHMHGLRPAAWVQGNAERLPLGDRSQDIVTTVFLYHELPPEVRKTVTTEMARVLRPGGLIVFIDSLQMGDKPAWDGLLEAFPVRFHEPYYRHYTVDDLEAQFRGAGLTPVSSTTSFLAKVVVYRKD
jgi:ubiquinone/menaquinone biosynthesis C-methylase UbiE